MQTKEFNQLQKRLLKKLQNCHGNNVKVGQKAKDFLRTNNKGVTVVKTCNLRGVVKLSRFNACKAMLEGEILCLNLNFQDAMRKICTNKVKQQRKRTFMLHLAVKMPFQHRKINRQAKKAAPEIAKNNLPTAFKYSSKYHKEFAHQR